jgi:alkylresorcinol/alkylpyrone synthase
VSAAVITGVASAVPGLKQEQGDLWEGYFSQHYGGSELAGRVFANAGVQTRHGVVDPTVEDISSWSTGQRMARFVEEAMPLGDEALRAAMAKGGLAAEDVGLLAVVSCTGYATPGLDILLARDLGMSPDVQRLHIGHMGCYAAIPGLAAAADAVAARGKVAALLCLELTSLHVQPATEDAGQMVAHALFADAAAAVTLHPADGGGTLGLEVVDVVARTDVAKSDLMTWDVTDHGFRMGLSPRVPAVLRKHVGSVAEGLLAAHDLRPADVAGWAVHPGGPRIVEAVQKRLGLSDEQVAESQGVLRDYGNCSSATVLLILERMLAADRLKPGDHVVAMAFGPGLTLYMTLLRVRA